MPRNKSYKVINLPAEILNLLLTSIREKQIKPVVKDILYCTQLLMKHNLSSSMITLFLNYPHVCKQILEDLPEWSFNVAFVARNTFYDLTNPLDIESLNLSTPKKTLLLIQMIKERKEYLYKNSEYFISKGQIINFISKIDVVPLAYHDAIISWIQILNLSDIFNYLKREEIYRKFLLKFERIDELNILISCSLFEKIVLGNLDVNNVPNHFRSDWFDTLPKTNLENILLQNLQYMDVSNIINFIRDLKVPMYKNNQKKITLLFIHSLKQIDITKFESSKEVILHLVEKLENHEIIENNREIGLEIWNFIMSNRDYEEIYKLTPYSYKHVLINEENKYNPNFFYYIISFIMGSRSNYHEDWLRWDLVSIFAEENWPIIYALLAQPNNEEIDLVFDKIQYTGKAKEIKEDLKSDLEVTFPKKYHYKISHIKNLLSR